jgi:putative membrane protein
MLRLTPFSGSLFRLALSTIGAVSLLALAFITVRNAAALKVRRSTESFDASAVAVGPLARGDQRFITQAVALMADQTQMAQLALQQAANEHVRALAGQVRNEHTRLAREIRDLAERKNARQLDQPERGGADRLARADAKTFDHTYLTRTEEAELEAVDLFERAATQGEDPEIRALALKNAPVLQAELARVKELKKSLD